MKQILIIFLTIVWFRSYSQVDTSSKNKFDSFEEYKKAENERFLSFKEKREKEIKAFIENEENWNLITIETKGNVRENVQKISTKPTTQINTEKTTSKPSEKKAEHPSYVKNETKIEQKETYQHPLKNSKFRITSPFGYRTHPVYKTKRFHSGVDFGAAKGVPIYSIQNGTVLRAGTARGYGNYIVIDHGNGIKSAYAHMNEMFIKKGQSIKKGDKIGSVGMTGTATGNHLHFEIISNNKKTNPINYIPK